MLANSSNAVLENASGRLEADCIQKLAALNRQLKELQTSEDKANQLLAQNPLFEEFATQFTSIAGTDAHFCFKTLVVLFEHFATALQTPNAALRASLESVHSTFLELLFAQFALKTDVQADAMIQPHQAASLCELYFKHQALALIEQNKANITNHLKVLADPDSLVLIPMMKLTLQLVHRIIMLPCPQDHQELYQTLKRALAKQKQLSFNDITFSIYEALYQLKSSPEVLTQLLANIELAPGLFHQMVDTLTETHAWVKADAAHINAGISAEMIQNLLQYSSKGNMQIEMRQQQLVFLLACVTEQPSDHLASVVNAVLSLLRECSVRLEKQNKILAGTNHLVSDFTEDQINYCLLLLECIAFLPNEGIGAHPVVLPFRAAYIHNMISEIESLLHKLDPSLEIVTSQMPQLEKIKTQLRACPPTPAKADEGKSELKCYIESFMTKTEHPATAAKYRRELSNLGRAVDTFAGQYPTESTLVSQWKLRLEQVKAAAQAANSSPPRQASSSSSSSPISPSRLFFSFSKDE